MNTAGVAEIMRIEVAHTSLKPYRCHVMCVCVCVCVYIYIYYLSTFIISLNCFVGGGGDGAMMLILILARIVRGDIWSQWNTNQRKCCKL